MFPPPRCASTTMKRFHVPPRARIDKIIILYCVVNFTARRWRRRGRKCASVSRRNVRTARTGEIPDSQERIRRRVGVQQVRDRHHAYNNIAGCRDDVNNILLNTRVLPERNCTRPCRRCSEQRVIAANGETSEEGQKCVLLHYPSSRRSGSTGDDCGIGFRARSPGVRAHRSRSAVTVFN